MHMEDVAVQRATRGKEAIHALGVFSACPAASALRAASIRVLARSGNMPSARVSPRHSTAQALTAATTSAIPGRFDGSCSQQAWHRRRRQAGAQASGSGNRSEVQLCIFATMSWPAFIP